MKQLFLPIFLAVGCVLILQLTPAEGGHWPDSCGNNRTHNFTFGRKSYYDRVLYVNHTVRGSKFLQVQSFDVAIPPKGTYPRGLITAVEVADQFRDGTGGCVYLVKGGPGSLNVTLHVKSQRGKPVNFIINVYGH